MTITPTTPTQGDNPVTTSTTTTLQGLADDGILTVDGWVHTTDEAVIEYRKGMIRLVGLCGYTRYLNGVYAAVASFLRDYQRREWDSGNHEVADTIGGMVWDLDQRFHPIVVSRRAGGQAMKSHVDVIGDRCPDCGGWLIAGMHRNQQQGDRCKATVTL